MGVVAEAFAVASFAATLGAQTPAMPQPQSPAPTPMPQQPVIPQAPQAIVGYRSPVIALVQPAAGEVLAPDKAVLIFRFAQEEPADPLDASSFAVWVNGSVRTGSFQVGVSEAWGALSDRREAVLEPGAYQVTARICSTRGACGTTSATVAVASSETMPAEPASQGTSRRQRVIDLLLAGLKRLLGS